MSVNSNRSLSVVIPAYCEEANIVGTLENVTKALEPLGLRHEILVIDDGSRDRTAELVEAQAARFPAVRLLRNGMNRGFGWTYRRGVAEAALSHIVMVHGDNAWGWATLREFFSHVGDADVIVGYTRDMWRSRAFKRTILSKAFTALVSFASGYRLKYDNGLQIHPAAVLKSIDIESAGYAFQAEVLVKSLRLTRTYLEVPMDLTERVHGESKALRWKNVVDVGRTLKRIRALGRSSRPNGSGASGTVAAER